MFDISGIGIMRLKLLQTRSEDNLRTENDSGDGIRSDSLLRRASPYAAVSGATWFSAIQIAAEAS